MHNYVGVIPIELNALFSQADTSDQKLQGVQDVAVRWDLNMSRKYCSMSKTNLKSQYGHLNLMYFTHSPLFWEVRCSGAAATKFDFLGWKRADQCHLNIICFICKYTSRTHQWRQSISHPQKAACNSLHGCTSSRQLAWNYNSLALCLSFVCDDFCLSKLATIVFAVMEVLWLFFFLCIYL